MSVSERKVIVGMREKQDLVWIYRIYMQWTTPESKTNEPKKGANENQIEMMLVLLLQTIRVAANWKCRWIPHSKRSTAIYSNLTLTLLWKTSACFHLVPTFPSSASVECLQLLQCRPLLLFSSSWVGGSCWLLAVSRLSYPASLVCLITAPWLCSNPSLCCNFFRPSSSLVLVRSWFEVATLTHIFIILICLSHHSIGPKI